MIKYKSLRFLLFILYLSFSLAKKWKLHNLKENINENIKDSDSQDASVNPAISLLFYLQSSAKFYLLTVTLLRRDKVPNNCSRLSIVELWRNSGLFAKLIRRRPSAMIAVWEMPFISTYFTDWRTESTDKYTNNWAILARLPYLATSYDTS